MTTSATGANHFLDAFLGDDHTADFPDPVYVALLFDGTEIATGSYARAAANNDSAMWPDASGGTKTNAQPINFPEATADWGQIDGVRIMSASSGGYLIAGGDLGAPFTVLSGVAPFFGVGELLVAVT